MSQFVFDPEHLPSMIHLAQRLFEKERTRFLVVKFPRRSEYRVVFYKKNNAWMRSDVDVLYDTNEICLTA